MKIHTFIHNQNMELNISKFNFPCVIWNNDLILKLIELKYKNWIIYYKRLILNKSRENFAKYIIIKEFGGIFINIKLLKSLKKSNVSSIEALINSNDEMIFIYDNNNLSSIVDTFGNNKYILNDDIIIVKNNSNSFINYIMEKIDKSIIPSNEYQNKICLGDIFLSIQLDNFYQSNLNIDISNLNNDLSNDTWFNNFFLSNNLKLLYENNDNKNKFEKSIYFIKLSKNTFFNNKYKSEIYPNVPELIEPDKIIDNWKVFFIIKKYLENIMFILVYEFGNWIMIISLICLIVVINYFIKIFFIGIFNTQIDKAQIDSKILFSPKKYKFLKYLHKNWKLIQSEAINIMKNAPKLNISRTINDWYNAETYINTIKNKYGWIRSWTQNESTDMNNQLENGNYEWLNFGLIYFGDEFSENIKYCPNTYKILNEIKSHINICGFSWMMGGCFLQPHTDITGINSGALAMHLGLDIPKPDNTCRLVIKNSNNEYMYVNEENGKMFIFDATYEHYAYNLSNTDRLILYMDFII